jgi:hypothetical protein
MGKVDDAREILKALGLPAAQQNEMSALTLLALCGVKENCSWSESYRHSVRVTKEIMKFRLRLLSISPRDLRLALLLCILVIQRTRT